MITMKLRGIIALALALACTSAGAQTNPGTSPLSIAKGGTSASTASGARTALGLAIGSATQAWDADLDALAALSGTNTIYYRSASNTWTAVTVGGFLSFSAGTLNVGDAELVALAGLTSANNKCFYWTGSGTSATFDCSSFGRSVANAADASALRTLAGSVIGTDVQAFDADLSALAGLTSANNKCFYFTGSGTAATYDCSSFGRSVANAADASALRTLSGSVIGTNVQAFDADLSALAGLTSANNKCFYFTGSGTAAVYDCSSFGRSVSNAADASALRTLAGTVIGTDVQAYHARLADIAGITYAQGDILYHNGTNLVKLAKGTDGQFLKSTATNPAWDSIPGGGDMLASNNLSDVVSVSTARTNLGVLASASSTWTPVVTFATPGDLSVSYTTQAGQYLEFGNYVFAFFQVVTSTFTHTTASGALRLTGLPYTAAANGTGTLQWSGITKANYTDMVSQAAVGQTYMTLAASGSAQSVASVVTTDTPTGGAVRLIGLLIYTK
jgi:hypothetical protein